MGLLSWLRTPIAITLLAIAAAGAQAQTIDTIYQSSLAEPAAIASDPAGNLYVLNLGSATIAVFAPNGALTRTIAVDAVPGGYSALINASLAADAGGTIYLLSGDEIAGIDYAISKIAPDGAVTVIVGQNQGIATANGLVVDSVGNLYFTSGATVFKVSPGGLVTSYFIVSGPVFLFGLAIDPLNNLYLNENTTQILMLTPTGETRQIAYPGTAFAALAVDSGGTLYAADNRDLIVKIDPAGGTTTYAVSAAAGGIVCTPDGTPVFTQSYVAAGSEIDEITSSGMVAPLLVGTLNDPAGIVSDGHGSLYVTAIGGIDRVAASGAVSRFLSVQSVGSPLAMDSAGNLFAVSGSSVVKVTPDGTVSSVYSVPQTVDVSALAVDGAENVYVAEGSFPPPPFNPPSATVVKVAPNGVASVLSNQFELITSLQVDAAGDVFVSAPGDMISKGLALSPYIAEITPAGDERTITWDAGGPIALDASDHIYVVPPLSNQLLRYDLSGAASTVLNSPLLAQVTGLTIDPIGNLYATASYPDQLLQIVLTPSPLAAAVLPGSRSVQQGTAATVFASMVNGGDADLANCRPSLPGTAPSALSLDSQTTNPATNAPTGQPDQPVTIPAHGSQSFLLSFAASAPLVAPGQALSFGCDGATAAPILPGVGTVDLLFSAEPVADIVALAATGSGDGILQAPLGQGGAFAVATIDAGAAAPIIVTADTGGASLPVSVLLCQTDPATAQCLAMPTPSIQLAYAANATPTFSVFVTPSAAVPLDPGAARIFIRFSDAAGNLHGSTSVAVEAQ